MEPPGTRPPAPRTTGPPAHRPNHRPTLELRRGGCILEKQGPGTFGPGRLLTAPVCLLLPLSSLEPSQSARALISGQGKTLTAYSLVWLLFFPGDGWPALLGHSPADQHGR